MTSKRHAADKRKNENWRAKSWVPDELPCHRERPPGLEEPWSSGRAGTAHRWMPLNRRLSETTPARLLAIREALRKRHQTYQGRMTRRTKKGAIREAWVARRLKAPVAGMLVTLAPWQARALKHAPPEEQARVLRDCWTAACQVLQDSGWQPLGVDQHEDTAQVHATISCLRIDPKTQQLLEMRACSKWTIVMDRLRRFGIEHPDPRKMQWFEENLQRSGITPNLSAHRAVDAVLSAWIKSRNAQTLEKTYREEYADWQRQWAIKREARATMTLATRLSRVSRVAVGSLVTAQLMLLAGEAITHKERDRRQAMILRQATAMDRI